MCARVRDGGRFDVEEKEEIKSKVLRYTRKHRIFLHHLRVIFPHDVCFFSLHSVSIRRI